MMTDLTPYAGRWVALSESLVAGVGHTADEALRLAQRNRPKERFSLQYVEKPGGERLVLSPLLDRLRPLLAEADRPVYLVGGAVRDALLNRISHDLDFVVPHHAIRLAYKVGDALGQPAYPLDKERDTGRVVLPEAGTTFDFARFRGDDLESDLRDRDFTINAIAMPATAETSHSLIDPCHGQADLRARLIRQTDDNAIAADPVRALRALRLAHHLDFSLEERTAVAVTEAATLLSNTSIERIRDELLKLLATKAPHKALRQLADLGLMVETLPEIAALQGLAQSSPHHEPVLAHTLSVLRWLSQIEAIIENREISDPNLQFAARGLGKYRLQLHEHLTRSVDGGLDGRMLLRLGALFHDSGKRETQTIEADGRIRFIGHEKIGAELTGRRLRSMALSKQGVVHVKLIVAGHMRPLFLASAPQLPSRRAVFRYFRDTGSAGLDISLLALADHLATYNGVGDPDKWARLVEVVQLLWNHYFERHEETVAPPPLVTGGDLIDALYLKPGPEIGRLLRLIQEAQAAGEISSQAEALKFARQAHQ